MRTILPAFIRFSSEGIIIGRLLTGYADLEISLLNCTHVIRDDFDTVLKAMFRTRGETARINVGDSFGRQSCHEIGLGQHFETGIGAMRHCLKIRNQYAHCTWWDDNSGKLAFANLEEAAKENIYLTSLRSLTRMHVDVPLLQAQEEFFVYTDDIFAYVNYEGRLKAGKIASNPLSMPKQILPPPLHIP
jgi:hypothetical protein